ncbi:uncharacterized protein Z519_11001 [Cladophialophora bantiana CBS 173.52]|uniref:Heterokaryon incompatibility domain-containing protein n=1 Tax=Cladophialophora bantiana (strain ATCC 10958 / CBS 173.52 / CDC B-1940 / NIH 8579) TaxID=1442370 RepID=A0A0D2FP39_CLAB1|nr:uncharacterized protein Z519_11001 [Cladophialophora bantiana CBS 173.52]KIW88432.1 hypothetical protein Z519_11001 [Cladophialophora bantiana CBS 173.52]
MRLLKLDSRGELSLTNDLIQDIPCYAILSHTWGPNGDEVTFRDLEKGSAKRKASYNKIRFCGEQAQKDGLQYFWVDTCCIDKSSSAELQEAITSMFRWYRDAVKCYVYLSDVTVCKRNSDQTERPWEPAFRKSRWFRRGWTLQELLAPRSVEFFSREEELLGDKKMLEQQIHEITGISIAALRNAPLSQFGVDERLRWAETRNTQKEEDKAYCLLGIFNVFMPLIYGEGENAFVRLKAEIERSSRGSLNLPETGLENIGRKEAAKRSEMIAATDKSVSNLQGMEWSAEVAQLTASAGELIADFLDTSSLANDSALDLPNSLQWFFETQEYETFVASQGQTFLCYLSRPGNGKTVLVRHLLASFMRTAPSKKHRKAVYIPCERLTAGPQIMRSNQPEAEHAPSSSGLEPREQGRTVERLTSLREEGAEEDEDEEEASAEPSKEPSRGDGDQGKISQRQAYQPGERFALDARKYRQKLQRLALDPVASILNSLVGQLLYQDDFALDILEKAAQSMNMDLLALGKLLSTSSPTHTNHNDQLWKLCGRILETMHQADCEQEILVAFDEVEQIPYRARERFIPALRHFVAKMHSKSIKIRIFIASRPVRDLMESLQDLLMIDEKAELRGSSHMD